jgi:hypothetical protein
MVTIPPTPRTNSITVGAASAGPFLVGFRLFEADALKVYVNGTLSTDYVVSATFLNGYDDAASITFNYSLPISTEVMIDGAMVPERAADYLNGPQLVDLLNIELARLWATVSELAMLSGRSLQGFGSTVDFGGKRGVNVGAGINPSDVARLADLQSLIMASGNVPSPTGGQVGYFLKATSVGVFGWQALGALLALDGTLSAPGISFANETNTGFLRPSAGLIQAAIAGVLKAELSSGAFRLLTPLLREITAAVAAGTNAQGQGALTADFNVITTTAANPSGVTLPVAVAGRSIRIVNRGTNPINLYPAAGGTIGTLALNAPLSVPVGVAVDLFARTATQWEGYAVQQRSAVLDGLSAAGAVTAAWVDAAALVTAAESAFSSDNDTSWLTTAAALDLTGALLILADVKAQNTGGGTFTAGAWRTRDLNTVRYNGIPGASLTSNQITLPAGTYRVRAAAPVSRVQAHMAKLRNITAGADILLGTSGFAELAGSAYTVPSEILGTFTLAVSSVLEIQHYCTGTQGGVGFGWSTNIAAETYTVAEFQRLA